MQIETAILIGVMFGIATYLLLKKNFVHILFGFVILSNGANLFILAMSGDPEGKQSPVIIEGGGPVVDPPSSWGSRPTRCLRRWCSQRLSSALVLPCT